MSNTRAQLTTNLTAFVLGGKATFTVVSKRTSSRFTYRVTSKETDTKVLYFVSVLTGSDNTSDYAFIGTIFPDGAFRYSSNKSKLSAKAPSVIAFEWLWDAIRRSNNTCLAQVEFWHEGRCARCARPLTTPESIQTGLGPVCAAKG